MKGERMLGFLGLLAVGVLAFACISGCNRVSSPPKSAVQYPYHASPEREATIRAGLSRLRVGMTQGQAHAILGLPDEVTPLYEPKIINGRQVGYSLWYLVQRISGKGSVVERDEKLVVLRTDLGMKVTDVQHWGLTDAGPGK